MKSTRFYLVIFCLLFFVCVLSVYVKRGDVFEYLHEQEKLRLGQVPPVRLPPQRPLAFKNIFLIPMTSEQVLPGYTVLVNNGVIEKVGPAEEVEIDEAYQVINGSGKYVIPGLSDMHVHMDENGFNHRLFIMNGVTTVREMSGSRTVLDWVKDTGRQEILAPDIYTTSPVLRGRGKIASDSIVLDTVEHAEVEIQRLYREGYRILKPYTYLSSEVYSALMKEANNLGMQVVGHIPYSVGIQGAIEAGQDEIAHIHSFHQDFFIDFDEENVFKEYKIDRAKIPEIVGSVRHANIRVTTSLIVNQALQDSQDMDAYLKRPMQAYEVKWGSQLMRSPNYRLDKMWSADYLEKQYLPWIYHLIKVLHDKGVLLVLGTDSGVPGLIHGFSTHEELKLLVKAGLTPYEALLTSTRNAAIAVQELEKWGTVEEGKLANLLILAGNPLEDINNIHAIEGVVKSGRWISKDILNEIKKEIVNLLH